MESQPAKILIVDDVQDNLEILAGLLSFDGFRVQTARSGEAALKQVQESPPDIILLDILIPGMDGYEVCKRLKADDSTRDIPVIFVSSMGDLESKVKGFKAGAVDYINKPYQHAEVLVRVNTHISMSRMRRHLEEQNAELERLANTDYLTDLYNRRRFFHAAEAAFSVSLQTGRPISVALIDLDHFKHVNDTYGHQIGDQVLIHIAQLIREGCRNTDMPARYGGEEFAFLQPGIQRWDAFHIIERIRKEVETTPFTIGGNEIGMTFSAGIVDMQVCNGCSRIDDLINQADRALYRAKDAGRNKVVVFDD